MFNQLKEVNQLKDDTSYSAHEDGLLDYWNDIKLLDKLDSDSSLTNTNLFRFMDGPPFVSGELHIGHMAVSSIKSMVLNYQRQKGKKCLNKLGYDCHGLPVEQRICKEKELKTISDIENVGIDKFCEWCKEMIHKYSNPDNPQSWTPAMWRIGRWANYNKTYKTMDVEFMESTWNVFKTMYDKNLVYMGYKVVPYSWACQTSLSNFEASQNYQEINTKSVYVLFPLQNEDNTYFVAWTTTVWTLPSNIALCVGKDIDYVKIRKDDKSYYISKTTVNKIFKKDTYTVLETIKGKDLEGKRYYPIFDYFRDNSNLFRVVCDSYVKDTSSAGTGIVHQSPAFGNDDFNICVKNGLVTNTTVNDFCTVGCDGKFNNLVPEFENQHVFDDKTTVNLIIEIKKRGLFVKTEMIKHNYPYCYRTDTPLIYRIVKSVFIKVTDLSEKMLELNEKINWHPKIIGEKRFKNWISDVKDWSVSRTRYFGTPIPLWISDDGELECIGSRQELADLTGKDVESYTDIHKELMDRETFVKNGKTYTRITEIFDCWFESGCVPFGQIHYPFENRELIDSVDYLSDFIAEGLDQTRGWFYTLLVIATAMTDGTKVPFKNVICTGLILDEHGNKISKRLGNYIDIKEYLVKYGADILRTYLIGSPLINAEPLLFNPEQVDILKRNQIRYINGIKFFLEHVNFFTKMGHQFKLLGVDKQYSEITNVFDRWILSKLSNLCTTIDNDMQNYRLNKVVDKQLDFIEELVNWYIKFNRKRMKGENGDKDWSNAISVLHFIIHTYARLCSPTTPFLSEYVHRHLYAPYLESYPSIHLMSYPEFESMFDDKLDRTFRYLKIICESIRCMRDKTDNHRSIKMPIKKCVVYHDDEDLLNMLSDNVSLIHEEINCINVDYMILKDNITLSLKPNFREIGKLFRKDTKKVVGIIKSQTSDNIKNIEDGLVSGEFNIPNMCFTVNKAPTVNESNLETYVVDDIMIGVDFILDDDVKKEYITKYLHSCIQNNRKEMDLHLWNRINIIIDRDIKKVVDNLDVILSKSLSNSNVLWCNDDSKFSYTIHVPIDGNKYKVSYNIVSI